MIGAVIRQVVTALCVMFLCCIAVAIVAMAAGAFGPAYWVILVVGNLTNGYGIFPRVLRAMRPTR